jgi:hypothetical protein
MGLVFSAVAVLCLWGACSRVQAQGARSEKPVIVEEWSVKPVRGETDPEDSFKDISNDPIARFLAERPLLYRLALNAVVANEDILPGRLVDFVYNLTGRDTPTRRTKPIIVPLRAFEPVGSVNPAGQIVTLIGVGRPVICAPGDVILVNFTVSQAPSGAEGAGRHHAVCMILPDPRALAHRGLLSPRFVPGPVIVRAQGTWFDRRGNVRETWTWTSLVMLK